MDIDDMSGDEITTYFMNTGELPWKYEIIVDKSKATMLDDGSFTIKYRHFADAVSKIKNNPFSKLNHEQILLIASNIEGYWESFNETVLMDVLYRPEVYISIFKHSNYQKAVFEDQIRFETEFMTKTILIYLDLISNPVKYFDSANKVGKRIVLYIRSQRDFLIKLLKRTNEIKKKEEIPQPNTKDNIPRKLEQTELVINGLNEYNFFNFLKDHSFKEESIYTIIKKHSGKELMPYTIALLKELGYLDYFFKEFTKTRSDGFKKLGKVFNINARRVKGNVNILNPKSMEDPFQYTSHKHIEKIKSQLKNYKNN